MFECFFIGFYRAKIRDGLYLIMRSQKRLKALYFTGAVMSRVYIENAVPGLCGWI